MINVKAFVGGYYLDLSEESAQRLVIGKMTVSNDQQLAFRLQLCGRIGKHGFSDLGQLTVPVMKGRIAEDIIERAIHRTQGIALQAGHGALIQLRVVFC